MRQSLRIEQSQRLALTPSLRLSLKILQYSTQELREKISEALEENPFLELDETIDTSENPEDISEGFIWSEAKSDDFPDFEDLSNSLTKHLLQQLNCLKINDKDRALVRWLIGSLDAHGFLTEPLEDIASDFQSGYITINDWRIALKLLQSFDPPGIGALNSRDSLKLQIESLIRSGSRPTDLCKHALEVITRYFDDLAYHRYELIRKSLGVTSEKFAEVLDIISELDPYPGNNFADNSFSYVIPEIKVLKKDNHWIATPIDSTFPVVRLNKVYAQCMSEIKKDENYSTLISKLDEAKEFLKNINERRLTVLRVAKAIVSRQQAFFDSGLSAMKPLVLRQVAEDLNLHESTISRVTNGKYLVCPRGTYELKFFFSASLPAQGDDASSTAIKEEIRLLVKNENPGKPLSDAKISDLLAQKGFTVARRTVAKYRISLNIANASERKSFSG